MGPIPHREIIEEFIKHNVYLKDVEAILLVGSYAVGNNNEYSDIDIYVLLKDKVKYRQRGNLIIGGYLIEYFMNPINKIKGYMRKDARGHGGSMANMLINGKLIYGNKEVIKKLKRMAYYYINKKNKPDLAKYYHAWDFYDDYKACKYHKELPYYNVLQALIEAYLYNNDYLLLPPQKVERVFKDQEYREKYKIKKFPNNKFNELVINCFDKPIEENLDILYEFVMEDGDFKIEEYKLRGKL